VGVAQLVGALVGQPAVAAFAVGRAAVDDGRLLGAAAAEGEADFPAEVLACHFDLSFLYWFVFVWVGVSGVELGWFVLLGGLLGLFGLLVVCCWGGL
jgi:hypothetical protein